MRKVLYSLCLSCILFTFAGVNTWASTADETLYASKAQQKAIQRLIVTELIGKGVSHPDAMGCYELTLLNVGLFEEKLIEVTNENKVKVASAFRNRVWLDVTFELAILGRKDSLSNYNGKITKRRCDLLFNDAVSILHPEVTTMLEASK